jgi:DNA end-binding protein Ku
MGTHSAAATSEWRINAMARSIWTGSISFGLVTIPVRVFSAIREHDVRFHQLAPDGSRIHLERVSEKTGRKVEFKNIKKGYETSKGK